MDEEEETRTMDLTRPFDKLPRRADDLKATLESLHQDLSHLDQKEEDQDTRYLDEMAQELVQSWVLNHKDNAIKMLVGCCLADILFIYVPNPPFSNRQLKEILQFLLDRVPGVHQAKNSLVFRRSFYILEKLALSTASCLLINLRDDPNDPCTAEELMVNLVNTMFEIVVVPSQVEEIEEWVADLVIALMDNLEHVSPQLLDQLLSRLIVENTKATDQVRGFVMAAKIVKICANRLREPISQLLTNLVSGVAQTRSTRRRTRRSLNSRKSMQSVGNEDEEDEDSEMSDIEDVDEDEEVDDHRAKLTSANDETVELKDHIHELVFQLFKIDSSLLLYTLPQFAGQLEVDDLDVRTKAVDLFGRIFCEVDNETFLQENDRIWAAFLRRIHDINTDIRISLVRFAGFALNAAPWGKPKEEEKEDESSNGSTSDEDEGVRAKNHNHGRAWFVRHFIAPGFQSNYAKMISIGRTDTSAEEPSFLELALNDKEVAVRRESVEVVVDFIRSQSCLQYFKSCNVGDGLLRALARRMSDKKIDISNNALEGLARCFANNLVQQYWVPRTQAITETDQMEQDDSDDEEDEEVQDVIDPMDDMTKHEKFAEETLGWIPDEILKQHFQQRSSMDDTLSYRSVMCRSFEMILNPAISTTQKQDEHRQQRSSILGWIWISLSETGQKGFERIFLQQRARLYDLMNSVIAAHYSSRGQRKRSRNALFDDEDQGGDGDDNKQEDEEEEGDDDENDKENKANRRRPRKRTSQTKKDAPLSALALTMKKKLEGIASDYIPKSRCPKAEKLMSDLWDFKDKYLFRDLKVIFDTESSQEQVEEAQTDALKRVGSKTETSRILRLMFIRMCNSIITKHTMKDLVGSVIRYESSRSQDERVVSLCELVQQIMDKFPLLSVPLDQCTWMLRAARGKYCKNDKDTKRKKRVTMVSDLVAETFCRTTWMLTTNKAIDALSQSSKDEILTLVEDIVVHSGDLPCTKACTKIWISTCKESRGIDLDHGRFEKVMKQIVRGVLKPPSSMHLACSFAALKVVLKRHPVACSDGELGLFKAINLAFDRAKAPFHKTGKSPTKAKLLTEGKVKSECIKVVCYEVIRRAKQWPGPDVEETQKFVLLLRKIVADGGDPWTREKLRKERRATMGQRNEENPAEENDMKGDGAQEDISPWPPSSLEHIADLRLAAARSLVKLQASCNTTENRVILREGNDRTMFPRQVQRWIELSWVAMDPSPEIRESFVATVYAQFIKMGRELFHYGAFLVLACASSGVNHPQTESFRLMKLLLQYLQTHFERGRQRAAASGTKDQSFSQLAPENMISSLIYLLAHHPEVPTGSQQAVHDFICKTSSQKMLMKPFIILFDVLEGLNKDHGANAGLLFALVDLMRRRRDILDPNSATIHMIGEMCQMLIKNRMKLSPENLEHPGNVLLPMVYVEAPKTGSVVVGPEDNNGQPSSPGVSPIPAKSRNVRKSPGWRLELLQSTLPAGFELKVGGGTHHHHHHHHNLPTPKAKKRRKQLLSPARGDETDPAQASSSTPTRRQPSRSTKAKQNSYQDVDSGEEEEGEPQSV